MAIFFIANTISITLFTREGLNEVLLLIINMSY